MYKIRFGLVIGLILAFVAPQAIYAQTDIIIDPADSLRVTTPAPAATVSKQINITWQIQDNDQTNIPYEVSLVPGKSCQQTALVNKSGSVTSSNQLQTLQLETPSTHVPDGEYCLEVCVGLKQQQNSYAVCNQRQVSVRNLNNAPIIISQPPADRQIKEPTSWKYKVSAVDPEMDEIIYSLDQAPAFLLIDSQSGEVTVGDGFQKGIYTFSVIASDSLGIGSKQVWQVELTTDDTRTSSSSSTTSLPTANLRFTAPIAGAKLSGDLNRVSWQINGSTQRISRQVLLYKQGDNGTEQLIAELPSTTRSFIWDVSNINNDDYQLILRVRYQDSTPTQTVVSDKFIVDNPPTGETTSRLLITNLAPADATSVTTLRPTISADFAKPPNKQVDTQSLVVEVDGVNRTSWCGQISETGFSCQPIIDLQPGQHKVRVGIQTTDKQLVVKEWTFSVAASAASSSAAGGIGLNLGNINWLLICGVLLLLGLVIILPITIYQLWKRRQQDVEVVTYSVGDDSDLAPAINEDFYVIPAEPVQTSAHTPAPTSTASESKVDYVDPTQYGSYEDYLKAVNDKLATSEPVYMTPQQTTTTTTTETNYITTPDYLAEMPKSTEPEKKEEANEQPKKEENKPPTDPSVPDWLQPV